MTAGHRSDEAPAGTTPLPVSVVIPAYNREDMVARAVRSALEQRPRPPAQVIVVDDCSSDRTADAAARAGAEVVRHDVNRGEGGARNTGIAHAREEWIALLDSDDEWLSHLLATLWPVRDRHVMVGGASLNCSQDGGYSYAGVLGSRPVVLHSPTAVVYPENFVAASGTMVRRACLEAAGGYAAELKGGADMDLWIRLLELGTGVVVPRPVVRYHLHSGQVTTDVEMMASAHRGVVARYAGRSWWKPDVLERWEGGANYDAAKRALKSGRRGDAARHLIGVVRSPTRLRGAAGIVLRRLRLRRHTGLIDRAGGPSVAILPGTGATYDGARDLRAMSTGRALASLALCPAHEVIAGSMLQGITARLLGVRVVTRPDSAVRARGRTPL